MSKYFNKLFILEMANNHQGSVETGLEIIKQAAEICEPYKKYGFQFAIKFQYRDLDTFIHPDYRGNHDYKFVKRFEETRLEEHDFVRMKMLAEKLGFITVCTPFDENSVDKIINHDYDIIKIASCSFTDWPLLEKIAMATKPIIASCGGAELEDIDRVVSFMTNRNKGFALLHCVPEYPTAKENMQLWQIEFLRKRYPNINIGYSQHNQSTRYIAKCDVIEFHIKLDEEGNNYSMPLYELGLYLEMASKTLAMGGIRDKRYEIPQEQKDTIRSLQRGAYAKEELKEGDILTKDNVYFAMPCQDRQLTANNFSKYEEYTYYNDEGFRLDKDEAIMFNDTLYKNKRQQVLDIVKKLIPIIKESGVVIPDLCEMDLSHHYGIDRFAEFGAAIFNIINNDRYCKKIIIMLPHQCHPEHYHVKKHETFHVLFGELSVVLNNKENTRKSTDDNLVIVNNEVRHSFRTKTGCVFEEVSTTHYSSDSFYTDENVQENRKTRLTFHKEWLEGEVK